MVEVVGASVVVVLGTAVVVVVDRSMIVVVGSRLVSGGVVTDFAEVPFDEPAADAKTTTATPITPPSTHVRRATRPFSPERTPDRRHPRK